MDEMERSFSFTARGLNAMLETVNDPAFHEQDAEKIFMALSSQMQVVPFCEYLKRYVYLHSGIVGNYRNVPLEEYRDTICDAFFATGTPASMKHLSTRVSLRVLSWLQQEKVRRGVVLLLGFGLSMPAEDVDDFLTKALHEHRLDENDPLEAVCAYCYRHHYGFLKMRQLMQVLMEAEEGQPLTLLTGWNQPAGRAISREVAEEDERLIREILARKKSDDSAGWRARTIRHFRELFIRAEKAVCPDGPRAESGRDGCGAQDGEVKKWNCSVIEDVLYASVPKEKNGNLVAQIHSSLPDVLAGKRLSRQRLSRLTHGTEEPSRYDLMTFSFLICAKTQSQTDAKTRCLLFMKETNRILTDCGYGEMYPADPYEYFLLMCVLSMDPLGTFSDVLEMSYGKTRPAKAGGTDG